MNCIVMNLKNKAVTEYKEVEFTDGANLSNKVFYASESGILEESSERSAIEATIGLPILDMADGGIRMDAKYVYLDWNGAQMIINVDGYNYNADEVNGESRVILGKGLRPRHLPISLTTTEPFVLRSIGVDCYVTKHKRR